MARSRALGTAPALWVVEILSSRGALPALVEALTLGVDLSRRPDLAGAWDESALLDLSLALNASLFAIRSSSSL